MQRQHQYKREKQLINVQLGILILTYISGSISILFKFEIDLKVGKLIEKTKVEEINASYARYY